MGKVVVLSLLLLSVSYVSAYANEDSKEELFLREESIMSSQGRISSELGIFYRRQTGSRNGNLVKRDTSFITAIVRYGINSNSELSLSAPYQYVHDDLSLQNQPVDEASNSDVGDVVANFKYQLLFDSENTPDLIINLAIDGNNGNSDSGNNPPLGSGHWEYSISTLFATSFDPAIYFAQLGYRYVEPATFSRIEQAPGNSIFLPL